MQPKKEKGGPSENREACATGRGFQSGTLSPRRPTRAKPYGTNAKEERSDRLNFYPRYRTSGSCSLGGSSQKSEIAQCRNPFSGRPQTVRLNFAGKEMREVIVITKSWPSPIKKPAGDYPAGQKNWISRSDHGLEARSLPPPAAAAAPAAASTPITGRAAPTPPPSTMPASVRMTPS